jgi:hypothetical protein
MIYNDGYDVDKKFRVIKCPNCENEVFSDNAFHCKICGTKIYNICEGEPNYDNYGNIENYTYHDNHGDARYCEQCGRMTYFFKEGFLRPWEEAKRDIESAQGVQFIEATEEEAITMLYGDDDIPF